MIKANLGFWPLAALGLLGVAQAAPPDKSGFQLFNRVPDSLLRELSPDRPDKTESPYTVDAGHFQIEMDFANYTFDSTDGTTVHAWNLAPINVKVGLLPSVDAQFIFDGYENVRTKDSATGAATRQSGAGDFTTRLKINLWGNDGGRTAFALLPFVKIPTSTAHLGNNAVEGGIIFPFAVSLPKEFALGLETGASFLQNENDSNLHAEFINSVTVGHNLIGQLDGYVEFYSSVSTGRGAGWTGSVDAGLCYAINKNVQLDCGCNCGVTRAADDFNPFVGLTVRF